MKRLIKTASLTLLLAAFLSIGGAATAKADDCKPTTNPLSCACASGGGVSGAAAACSADGSNTISGPNGTIMKASFVIATIAGITAVIIIIVGGFQFITSTGDPQKVASARSAVLGAAIGLVIVAAAEGIVVFVVSKL